MIKLISVVSGVALTALSGAAHAVVAVPEIDGSNAAIGIGLTIGVLALVKEFRRNK